MPSSEKSRAEPRAAQQRYQHRATLLHGSTRGLYKQNTQQTTQPGEAINHSVGRTGAQTAPLKVHQKPHPLKTAQPTGQRAFDHVPLATAHCKSTSITSGRLADGITGQLWLSPMLVPLDGL